MAKNTNNKYRIVYDPIGCQRVKVVVMFIVMIMVVLMIIVVVMVIVTIMVAVTIINSNGDGYCIGYDDGNNDIIEIKT